MPKRERAKLSWDKDLYAPYVLINSDIITPEEQRREYARLRKIANQRLKALGRSRFKDTQAYKKNVRKYIEPATALSDRELAYKLAEISRFITSESGSVTGQIRIEKKILKSLKESGYYFINKKNLQSFGEFMEEWRTSDINKLYDSERAADLYEVAIEKKIPPEQLAENFDIWLENLEKLQNAEIIRKRGRKKVTADDYAKELGIEYE